jgi:hypothetical protein
MGPNAALLSAMPSTASHDAGSPAPGIEADAAPLDWLQALLRQAMTEVMDGEGAPLQKAGAVARLGALYLRTHKTAELQKANRELTRRLNELEERLAAAEASRTELEPRAGRPIAEPAGGPAEGQRPSQSAPSTHLAASQSLPVPTRLPPDEFHTSEGPVPAGEVPVARPGPSRAPP